MLNKINDLPLIVNEHDYGRDVSYVTLGGFGGFCSTGLYEKSTKNFFHINRATMLIFTLMVKNYCKEINRIRTKIQVNKTTYSITIKTKQKKIEEDIYNLLDAVYDQKYDENAFIDAKEKILKDFSEKYSDAKFKAYLNILEFSDKNKDYNFIDLAKDIKEISFKEFDSIISKLVTFKNSLLLINGQIPSNTEKFIQLILDKKTETDDIQLIYSVRDPYLETDMHLVKQDKAYLEMGALRFNFLGENIGLEEQCLLLNIVGITLFSKRFDISIDSVDKSIVYMEAPLKEYKNEIYDIFANVNIAKLKNELLYVNNKLMTEKPYLFNNFLLNIELNNIDYLKYLDLLINMDESSLQDLVNRGKLKITEAHLIFKERKVFTNVK
jgi:hypothetical protein